LSHEFGNVRDLRGGTGIEGNVSVSSTALQGCQRVLVLGSGGAGKSTLARGLGDRLGLPVIHLDIHYWNFGWKPTPEPEWNHRVRRLAAEDAWVMDGNFSGSLALRLPRCDAIVFLDLPRSVCLRSVLVRWLRYRYRARPDLPEGCPEKFDLEFLRWVWHFPERSRPRVLAAIEQASPRVQVLRLTRRAQARALLCALPSCSGRSLSRAAATAD
jgi:adenylate kinase family enzyme